MYYIKTSNKNFNNRLFEKKDLVCYAKDLSEWLVEYAPDYSILCSIADRMPTQCT